MTAVMEGVIMTARIKPAVSSPVPNGAPATSTDWAAVTAELQRNAGFRVERISRRGDELYIDGYQTRYLHAAKGLGRATRILANATGDDYDWFTLRTTRVGMPIADLSINREAFAGAASTSATDRTLAALMASSCTRSQPTTREACSCATTSGSPVPSAPISPTTTTSSSTTPRAACRACVPTSAST